MNYSMFFGKVGRRTQLWFPTFILILGICIVGLPVCQSRAGCPAAVIEVKNGSGGLSKPNWFFQCGTGCTKAFYRVSNSGSSSKVITEVWARNGGGGENYCRSEAASGSGYDTAYGISIDPADCTATYTTNQSGSGYYRLSTYNNMWNISFNEYNSWSCDESSPYCAPCSTTGLSLSKQESQTITNECGMIHVITTSWFTNNDNTVRAVVTSDDSSDPGYSDEFTTEEVAQKVRGCARSVLDAQTTFVKGNAGCSFGVAADRSSVSAALARWRLAISETRADEDYKIKLTWQLNVNGVKTIETEERSAKGSDQPVWYYPSAAGELLEYKESLACGYSYSKSLTSAVVTPAK